MFLIDEYETKGEEKIRPLPNILEGRLWVDKRLTSNPITPMNARDYRQVLDMHNGLLTTTWTQEVSGTRLRLRVETVVHPYLPMVAQRWTIDSDFYTDLRYEAGTKGARVKVTDQAKNKVMWTWPPSGIQITEADKLGSDIRRRDPQAEQMMPWSSDGAKLSFVGAADTGHPFAFTRLVGVDESTSGASMVTARESMKRAVSDDNFPDVPESHWAYESLVHTSGSLFDEIVAESQAAWANRWQTDVEIDGPVEDQQAVRSFLFYLRSAVAPNGQMSISPFGLSNSQYNGHVFWDADIWVFPALALIDPDRAKAIAQYRIDTFAGAKKNAGDWQTPDKPNITELEPGIDKANYPKYAWESSVTGKETAPVAMRAEEHINGDVPWMLGQAASLGLVRPSSFLDAVHGAAKYWSKRSVAGAGGLEIKGVVSPDEIHFGDNDLYTNLLAQWCLNGGFWGTTGGTPVETHGRDAHATYKLPHDNVSFLSYDDDLLRGYKQAAAVLSIYPLQYPAAEKEAKAMMDRFADKVIKDGPAMTDSVHALIWARLGETDKAYDLWEKSWRDFVKEPYLQFSEKRHKTSTYFTTGAGGCLQTVLYGFLGFRIDSKKQDGALWSTDLALGRILSVKPQLPKSWKSVKFKNFNVMGRRYTLTASHSGVRVTQGDK